MVSFSVIMFNWLRCLFWLSYLGFYVLNLHTVLIHNQPLVSFCPPAPWLIEVLLLPGAFLKLLAHLYLFPLPNSEIFGEGKKNLFPLSNYLTHWIPFFLNDKNMKIQVYFFHLITSIFFFPPSSFLLKQSFWVPQFSDGLGFILSSYSCVKFKSVLKWHVYLHQL